MWTDFHFLTPLWFLALLPLALLGWAAARSGSGTDAWRRVIDERLFAVLSVGGEAGARRWWPLSLLALGWLIAVIALANPTFERQPVPAFRSDAARVVALDLSRSMLADDLTPTRLDRARYKLADILRRSGDGQVGLVAFAGDAFAVSPLTDDAKTILGMLDALSPEIMPLQGSRPDLAIRRGMDLLKQAGAQHGEVVLLTDDAGDQRALAAAEALRAAGHRLAVIGVGTAKGAPVPGVRTSQGEVIAALDAASLRALARAGGGAYAALSADDRDLNQVLSDPATLARTVQQNNPNQAEAWKELGPWIALLLLPLGALAFRRGWVLGVMLLIGAQAGVLAPRPALALGWGDLWQRRDQQAAQALSDGDYQRARTLAADPARLGTANYRLGDYAAAAEAFATVDDAEHHYNRGNALARAGQLQQAIAAYDQALAKEPGMPDARYNKAQVERLLRQQQEQQKQQSQHGQQGNRQEPSDQDQSKQDQAGKGQSGQDEAKQQQSEQDVSQPQQAGQDQEGQGQSGEDKGGQDQPSGGAEQQAGADQPQPKEVEPKDTQAGKETQAPSPSKGDGEDSDNGRQDTADTAPDQADRQRTEQAAADYRDEASRAGQAEQSQESEQAGQSVAAAERDLSPEELESRQAADQWLRRIPDDPAGLLRRKFLYQYRERSAEQGEVTAGNPW